MAAITPERAWWDVLHYTLGVAPDYNTKTIEGKVEIRFKVLSAQTKMQIDLQQPMKIERAYWSAGNLPIERDGNVYYVIFPAAPKRWKHTHHYTSIYTAHQEKLKMHPGMVAGYGKKTHREGHG